MPKPAAYIPRFKTYMAISIMAAVMAVIYLVQPASQGTGTGTALSCAFALLVVGAFAWYFGLWARRWLGELGLTRRGYAVVLVFVIVLAVAGCVLIELFFQQERDIKVYDFATFWVRTVEFRGLFETRAITDLLSVFLVHLSQEYTFVPAVPLALASYVFGKDYTGFCQSVYVLYYLPTCIFAVLLAMRLMMVAGKTAGHRAAAFIVCALVCVFNAGLSWPLMNGYVDIIGVLLIMVMLNLTLRWDGTVLDWRMILSLAILSVTTVLARRFFAFAVVGFFASFGVALVVDMVVSHRFSLARLVRLAATMAFIAATACLIIYILNPVIFHTFLGIDYATAYGKAFKEMTSLQNLKAIMQQSGYLWFFLSCLGAYLLFSVYASRLLCFRIALTSVIGFFLFRRVQDMFRHHAYIVLLSVILFLAVFCLFSLNFVASRKKVITKVLASALAVVVLAGYLVNVPLVFEPRLAELAATTQPLTTDLRRYPVVLASYDAITDINADLKERIQNSSERVYVVTVTPTFNPDYLLRSEMPEKFNAVDFILGTNNVDLRDGFPSQAFLAEYLLLEYPFRQEFMTRQEVVYQLFDMVVNSPYGEEYYQLEKTYPLLDDTEIRLYRRTKNVTPELVDELKTRLQAYYPDTPLVYTPSYFIAFATFMVPNNYTLYVNPNEVVFHFYKDAGTDAVVRVDNTAQFSRLAFDVRVTHQRASVEVRNQDGDLLRRTVGENETANFDIPIAGSEFIELVFTDPDPNNPAPAYIMVLQPQLQ